MLILISRIERELQPKVFQTADMCSVKELADKIWI
jgi:hypothetical protein